MSITYSTKNGYLPSMFVNESCPVCTNIQMIHHYKIELQDQMAIQSSNGKLRIMPTLAIAYCISTNKNKPWNL